MKIKQFLHQVWAQGAVSPVKGSKQADFRNHDQAKYQRIDHCSSFRAKAGRRKILAKIIRAHHSTEWPSIG